MPLSRITLQLTKTAKINYIVDTFAVLDEDTLPYEGSTHAVQEEVLVDDTFLIRLQQKKDLHRKQLNTPLTISTATTVMSDYFPKDMRSDTCNLHSGFSNMCGIQAMIMATDFDNYASSVRACSAIFEPVLHMVASLPTSLEILVVQDND